MRDVEPTPEDYDAAKRQLARDPREVMLEVFARHEARKRIARERAERRRRLLHRLLPFRRAA